MAAKLTRLTHKIEVQLHLVTESCTICSSRSRRPVRKILDNPRIIFRETVHVFRGLRLHSTTRTNIRVPEWISTQHFSVHGPRQLSGIALGYELDVRGFESRQRLGIFLYITASRLSLGPTQPPVQWVTGTLPLEVKRPGREADHSPPSSAEVKNAWSYTSTPTICLHGVVLS
jgi:hypothetical protein